MGNEDTNGIIAQMAGVREYTQGEHPDLVVHSGRLVIRAWNDGTSMETRVDLLDLLAWCKSNADNIKGLVDALTGGPPSGGKSRLILPPSSR
jgi:hypothetical protein